MESKSFVSPCPTVADLAAWVNGRVVGDANLVVQRLGRIEDAQPGDITFFSDQRYRFFAQQSQASVFVVESESLLEGKTCIVTQNASWSFAKIAEKYLEPLRSLPTGISDKAEIDASAVVAKDVSIGPYVVIEAGVEVGAGTVIEAGSFVGARSRLGVDCYIYPSVVIREGSWLGDRVIIHSGSVLGSDGFGYVTIQKQVVKIPQLGIVRIEDDVEIGANVTIDRARFDATVVGVGTKIDNQVQIAHNVKIGWGCIIVAQSGIAGSVSIGNYVTMAARSLVLGHLKVASHITLAARSCVTKTLKSKGHYFGFPAIKHNEEKKRMVLRSKLPEMYQTLKALQLQIEQLEEKLRDSH